MTTLSPAAQAILQINGDLYDQPVLSVIAAALRAAADQVVPENRFGPPENAATAQREITRTNLLAIAIELEGQS